MHCSCDSQGLVKFKQRKGVVKQKPREESRLPWHCRHSAQQTGCIQGTETWMLTTEISARVRRNWLVDSNYDNENDMMMMMILLRLQLLRIRSSSMLKLEVTSETDSFSIF